MDQGAGRGQQQQPSSRVTKFKKNMEESVVPPATKKGEENVKRPTPKEWEEAVEKLKRNLEKRDAALNAKD